MINSSWDEAAQEIVVKRLRSTSASRSRPNAGCSCRTSRAPTRCRWPAWPGRSTELAATARAGKATPADLAGGTITITNVGVFGVDAGHADPDCRARPRSWPSARCSDLPWVVDGALAVRKVTTLSLSFDHRIVDGELGSAVLRDVGSMLADPVRMLGVVLSSHGPQPTCRRSRKMDAHDGAQAARRGRRDGRVPGADLGAPGVQLGRRLPAGRGLRHPARTTSAGCRTSSPLRSCTSPGSTSRATALPLFVLGVLAAYRSIARFLVVSLIVLVTSGHGGVAVPVEQRS